jgi:hypothetical protein
VCAGHCDAAVAPAAREAVLHAVLGVHDGLSMQPCIEKEMAAAATQGCNGCAMCARV